MNPRFHTLNTSVKGIFHFWKDGDAPPKFPSCSGPPLAVSLSNNPHFEGSAIKETVSNWVLLLLHSLLPCCIRCADKSWVQVGWKSRKQASSIMFLFVHSWLGFNTVRLDSLNYHTWDSAYRINIPPKTTRVLETVSPAHI